MTRSSVSEEDVEQWIISAARAADDKKAVDTVVLRIGSLLAITDAFVITHGASDRQARAIAEAVEEAVKAVGGPAPIRIEGLSEAQWILLDYGDFVVHVFQPETREFYDLERLWADAPRLAWEEERVS